MDNPPTDAPRPLKRNSNDVGWEFGVLCNPKNVDKVKCKLCGKEFSGGIYRMKEHIAHVKGNVSACPVSCKADQEKCKQAILDAKEKKSLKRKHEQELRAEVNINKGSNVEELERELGTLKSPHFQGPIDQYATSINPEASLTAQARQQNIHDAISKEKTHAVRQYCARWMYEANVAFNAIDNESFRLFCEALGQFGPGWVPPSQYQLRGPLLIEEQKRTKEKLKNLEEEWETEGCSVMTDAWSDMKRRSIMNLCVNSRGGTCFLSSKDTSKDSHTGEYIFNYIDQWIEDIGAAKVVKVVTDNATNNVAAAKMLKQKRPNIFWTGCAAHTIDLMLEGISKLPGIAKIIDQAKAVTIIIYAHHTTLSMMRTCTNNRDIVRPGATRFATCFLTMQSLYDKKAQLMSMFGSDEWHSCKHSKCLKGKNTFDTIMSHGFWSSVNVVLKIFSPLVKVLRLADGEKVPSLGFIYGEIIEAKNSIKEASNHLEKNYQPIFRIIDEKMKDRLDTPLHVAAYFLNPYYFYKDPEIQKDYEIMEGFIACVETYYHGDFEKQNRVVNQELSLYKSKSGSFGRTLALKGCEIKDDKFDPGLYVQIACLSLTFDLYSSIRVI
ncbi:uncharacterized protein LOC106378015 [Brassica napus]|uniref:uncharacterized protein LOC106378015 n=1 Tax=Brassica napus TaxID=3708 RepID=UPI0020786B14|nr:uncharacterized protein LOC106378015 [Brassica napus]